MDATFWATVALVIFLAGVIYLKVPGMVTKGLDDRSSKIRDELDEARKLREEAQALLAEFQGKRKEAEQEAEEIVAAAKREATALADDAARKTAEFVKRRTALAEQKIEQAEASALAEVRASAVDVAISAAEQIIASKVTGTKANDLIKSSIAEVKSKLN
ncbi:MAG: F0F1 ATP synthase subunit B [Pseudomonadota bacterium]